MAADHSPTTEQHANKYAWVKDLTDDSFDYLRELPYTISIPSFAAVIVHAGLVPGCPLDMQQPLDMTTMRNIVEVDDGVFETTQRHNIGSGWAASWPGPQHVYFGHDARRSLQLHAYSTGLDTRCVYGGQLTGQLVERGGLRKAIVSVDAKQTYSPPNDGED